MRYLLLIIILAVFLLPTIAQEDQLTPYEVALQRIEEARVSGANRLDLHWMHLAEVPPEIGNLSKLQYLFLSMNQLTSIPPEIGNLSSLRELHLPSNLLTGLPSEIGNLHNLEILALDFNRLDSLPPEIGNLTNLRILSLTDNSLSSLPPEIGNLRDLQMLFLDGNPLISPPQEILEYGTPGILDYLRNEAWWHLQRLIAGGAGAIGIVASLILGIRWRNRRYEKKKKG